jgi:hypothetical protein
MRRRSRAPIGAVLLVACAASARAQTTKWEIIDNSFLVEESFNQEAGVFQNILTWRRVDSRNWAAAFTQEWPAPNVTHQFSYTIPFSSTDGVRGFDDVLLNYRYQLLAETERRPALSPRLSVILPGGGIQVNVPASKQFGNLYVHANAGWTWLPEADATPQIGGSGIWRAAPMFNLMLEAVADVGEDVTVSPGFRRGWNFRNHQLVVGAALPVTRADGTTTVTLLAYFSYELPFR